MKKSKIKFMSQAGLIAAVYVTVTCISAFLGIAYGPIQFRFSEALNMLAVFTPAAIPGLTLGCFISNLASPYGAIDILCGTAATLFSSILIYLTANKFRKSEYAVPLFPTVINALIIGAEVTFFLPDGEKIGFITAALSIGIGEAVSCFGLGIPLTLLIKKRFADIFKL